MSRESCRQAWTWMIAWRGRGSNRSTQDLGWNRYGVWRGKEELRMMAYGPIGKKHGVAVI